MILRTRFTDGAEVNTDIGDQYVLIQKQVSQDKFEETAKIHFGDNLKSFEDANYAFIVYKNGKEIIPLYKEFGNYVFSDSGELFHNITFK